MYAQSVCYHNFVAYLDLQVTLPVGILTIYVYLRFLTTKALNNRYIQADEMGLKALSKALDNKGKICDIDNRR